MLNRSCLLGSKKKTSQNNLPRENQSAPFLLDSHTAM